jgi:hypothetical protein
MCIIICLVIVLSAHSGFDCKSSAIDELKVSSNYCMHRLVVYAELKPAGHMDALATCSIITAGLS